MIQIRELFDNPVPISSDKVNSNGTWFAHFMVDNISYEFSAIIDKSFGKEEYEIFFERDIWNIQHPDEAIGITGTGNAATVFSTVLVCLKKFVSEVKPEIFSFSALEPSRIKLYNVFAVAIHKALPDYQFTDRKVKNLETKFYFRKIQ